MASSLSVELWRSWPAPCLYNGRGLGLPLVCGVTLYPISKSDCDPTCSYRKRSKTPSAAVSRPQDASSPGTRQSPQDLAATLARSVFILYPRWLGLPHYCSPHSFDHLQLVSLLPVDFIFLFPGLPDLPHLSLITCRAWDGTYHKFKFGTWNSPQESLPRNP